MTEYALIPVMRASSFTGPRRRGDTIAAFACADADRYDELVTIRWTLARDGYARGYVNGKATSMHRVVAGCDPGTGRIVHHRNHNKLDNRRSNLMVCADHYEHGEAEELERVVVWRPKQAAA